jgi:RecA/RadA recombinase
MAKRLNKSLMETVSKEIKSSFNLNSFKDKKGLISNVKFKEQKWIPFSSALQKALSLPGIPMGHITMVRGKSNTGKSTLSIEAVIAAQKSGILPVIIITEMKHSWEHWRTMGFEMEDVLDEQGNVIDHNGFFIYRDRSTLSSIEDIAVFIADLIDEQKKGNLPYDLLFMWDSTNAGTSKIEAQKDGKKVEFALRTKIACDKNHVNGITTKGTIISTVHGFIPDDAKIVSKYKKEHAHEWIDILGKGDYVIQEDDSEWSEKEHITDILEIDE